MGYTLVLYLGLMAVGTVIGAKVMKKDREYPWIGRLQFIALIVLIAALGVKLGADEQVISSLGDIGLSAFVVAVASIAGSVFCVHILRKMIKIDREGVRRND